MVEESSKLAECVGKTRSLLKRILSEGIDNCVTKLDNDPQGYLSQPLTLLEAVLQECHNTFTACFHSFYPTPALQWACLCDLLNCLDQVRLLAEGLLMGVQGQTTSSYRSLLLFYCRNQTRSLTCSPQQIQKYNKSNSIPYSCSTSCLSGHCRGQLPHIQQPSPGGSDVSTVQHLGQADIHPAHCI